MTGKTEAMLKLRSITAKMAAFCVRLSVMDDVPERIAKEGMKLAHEHKAAIIPPLTSDDFEEMRRPRQDRLDEVLGGQSEP